MYENKRNFTAKDIYDKQFKLDARGYRPQEVDSFLDEVIKDYVASETIQKKLEAEISALEQEDGYPPVVRLGKNDLSISKSDFKDKLMDLLDSNLIEP